MIEVLVINGIIVINLIKLNVNLQGMQIINYFVLRILLGGQDLLNRIVSALQGLNLGHIPVMGNGGVCHNGIISYFF